MIAKRKREKKVDKLRHKYQEKRKECLAKWEPEETRTNTNLNINQAPAAT